MIMIIGFGKGWIIELSSKEIKGILIHDNGDRLYKQLQYFIQLIILRIDKSSRNTQIKKFQLILLQRPPKYLQIYLIQIILILLISSKVRNQFHHYVYIQKISQSIIVVYFNSLPIIQYLKINKNQMFRILNHCQKAFTTVNAQFTINKSRNAIRFQAQNINWDYEELNYQTMAMAKGLSSLSFQKNDNILLRLPQSQQSQAYVSRLGAAAIGANIITSSAITLQQLNNQLKTNNIKAVIFEPTLPFGQKQLIDGIYELMPEIKNLVQGSQLYSKNYPSLTYLIQTGFYTLSGVFKFRNILNYASDKYFKLSEIAEVEAVRLPESNLPLLITDASNDFSFRAGALNSVINGRFVVCAEPSDIGRVCSAYDNKIEIIATRQLQVPDGVTVIVEKGCGLFSGRKNLIEV